MASQKLKKPSPIQKAQPPVFALRVLELILPREIKDQLIGDLYEEFAEEESSAGAKNASQWFWKQTVKESAYWILRERTSALARTLVSVFYICLLLVILLMSEFVIQIEGEIVILGLILILSLMFLVVSRNKDGLSDLLVFLVHREADMSRSRMLKVSNLLRSIRNTTSVFCSAFIIVLLAAFLNPIFSIWEFPIGQFLTGLSTLTSLHSAAFIAILTLYEEKVQQKLNYRDSAYFEMEAEIV
ncbi:MAG: hypothetical protein MI746_01785 [Pseudomonadales bacterium]|nr:hypothetical protein [Pseudomonadales bacterium]